MLQKGVTQLVNLTDIEDTIEYNYDVFHSFIGSEDIFTKKDMNPLKYSFSNK